MPCERCLASFTVLRRRRSCCECGRHFCGGCVSRSVCSSCRVLAARPLPRHQVDALRVRDLQCYLHEHKVSTAGCVEKEDLVALVVAHVDAPDFARPPPTRRANADIQHAFQQIKGFTTNLFQQAFDVKPTTSRPSGPTSPTPRPTSPTPHPQPQPQPASPNPSQPVPVPSARTERAHSETLTDTHDCLEIEDDPDDPDWEIVSTSLPGDSEVLLVVEETFRRAVSDPDLPSTIPDDDDDDDDDDDASAPSTSSTLRINLQDVKNLAQLERLKVRQLKELLALNRVDFRGCCERKELLERAKRLWRESTKSREDLEASDTNEELCRICMDAPMECVMLECGHIATCLACGKRLHECPICREYVVRVVRFFRS